MYLYLSTNIKRIRSTSTGYRVDGAASSYYVNSYPVNTEASQMWYEYMVSGDVVHLVNVASGLALDSNDDGKVYILAGNAGDYQKWRKVGSKLINVSTGKALQTLFTHAIFTDTYDPNYNDWWQNWLLE